MTIKSEMHLSPQEQCRAVAWERCSHAPLKHRTFLSSANNLKALLRTRQRRQARLVTAVMEKLNSQLHTFHLIKRVSSTHDAQSTRTPSMCSFSTPLETVSAPSTFLGLNSRRVDFVADSHLHASQSVLID